MGNDADPDKWDYPPHTKAKHDILARYLDGWYPILSRWNGRILFLDGFAGRGRYKNGEEGSPLIALRRLVEHQHFPRMSHREFKFMFVEASKDNADSLEFEINQLKIKLAPWPANVETTVINNKFDVTASGIIEYLREQKKMLAPTFAFVDPFGYSGLPMDLLADLLDYPKTEVFVNFMVGHVQRFITRDGQENAMRGLFGMDVRDILADMDDANRVEHLRQVYGRQLQQRAKFDHVQSFEMKNSTGNTSYYLYHGTRHRLGVKLMKAAMWRVDPGGGYTFSDRLANESVLFTAEPDLRPLRNDYLTNLPKNVFITIDDLEWYTLLNTPYRETHVRSVLTPLENEGLITVLRQGKRGFPLGKTKIAIN